VNKLLIVGRGTADPAGKLSSNLYDIYQCRVYSE